MIIHPVILCGGAGTRLWPLSRKSYPKQFAQISGEHSLFQAAVNRLTGSMFADPVILTNNDFRFIATEQMNTIGRKAAAILIISIYSCLFFMEKLYCQSFRNLASTVI